MTIHFLTLFPAMYQGPLSESILKRAVDKGLVSFNVVNIRDFSSDKHHTADNPPYGGGPGMVMMIEPIDKALASIGAKKGTPNQKIILLSAKGAPYSQSHARDLSGIESLVFISGHYEGVDERVALHLIDEEVRIGDYVLTGGELASMVIADSVVRLLPGALGDENSSVEESHSNEGFLEYPHYTRPAIYNGWNVPEVLLNGNHAEIAKWRAQQAASATNTSS